MSWQIQRTESFDRWWEKENIHNSNYQYHEAALQEFKNVPLPHNIQNCHFRNSSFECWSARLPDKIRKQGKSGGFRIIFIIDIEEGIIYLQGIFRRGNLGFKDQGGKYDTAHGDLIKDLARQFVETKLD